MAVSAFFNPTMNDPIVSSLELIHMPEIYNRLVGRYPKQTDFDFIKEMGRMVPVAQTSYQIHEENKIFDSVLIAAKSNPSGSLVRITLDATNHTVSGTRSYPRLYDRVEFLNNAQGLIVAKNDSVDNAHTIDILPINSTYNVVTAAVVGDALGIFSDAHEEGGSGPREILIPTTTVFSNQVQIFRDKMSVTSSEQTNQTWVEFEFPAGHPKAGETGKFLYIKGEADMIERYQGKRILGLLTNDISDAGLTIVDENGVTQPVRTTRGFLPHLRQYAQLSDYVTQPGMGTLDTWVKLLNKTYQGDENMVWMGLNFSLGFKNFGVDLMKNGAVVYNSSTGAEMDAVKLGFSTIGLPGQTLHFKRLQSLSHADTTGLPGMSYSDLAVVCPMGKVKDANSAKMMDAFAVKYKKASGKGARDTYKIWETGGNSDAGTDASLKRNLHIASEEGGQIYGAQRFIYTTKKSA